LIAIIKLIIILLIDENLFCAIYKRYKTFVLGEYKTFTGFGLYANPNWLGMLTNLFPNYGGFVQSHSINNTMTYKKWMYLGIVYDYTKGTKFFAHKREEL
jgi:hypothetical protein